MEHTSGSTGTSKAAPTGGGRYQCNQCPSCFKRPEHLKRHQQGHDGQKRFSCPVCGKGFSRSDILARHETTHRFSDQVHNGNVRGRACTECAKARERCSKGEPCVRCSTRRLRCAYPEGSILRRSPVPPTVPPNSATIGPGPGMGMGRGVGTGPAATPGMAVMEGSVVVPGIIPPNMEDASLLAGTEPAPGYEYDGIPMGRWGLGAPPGPTPTESGWQVPPPAHHHHSHHHPGVLPSVEEQPMMYNNLHARLGIQTTSGMAGSSHTAATAAAAQGMMFYDHDNATSSAHHPHQQGQQHSQGPPHHQPSRGYAPAPVVNYTTSTHPTQVLSYAVPPSQPPSSYPMGWVATQPPLDIQQQRQQQSQYSAPAGHVDRSHTPAPVYQQHSPSDLVPPSHRYPDVYGMPMEHGQQHMGAGHVMGGPGGGGRGPKEEGGRLAEEGW